MKIYISLPIKSYEKSVRARYDKAAEEIKSKYPDAEICGPTNINDFSDNGLDPNAPVHDWSWHLGEDIKDLLNCDMIYLCRGWKYSKGCLTERAVAIENDIEVVTAPFASERIGIYNYTA